MTLQQQSSPKQTDGQFLQTYKAAPPAPLSRRLAAMVYELLILTAIVIIALMLSSVVIKEILDNELFRGIFVGVSVLTCAAGWFVWCWVLSGQTLPMKVWNLRVQHPDGSKIKWPIAILRLTLAVFSLGLFGAGFLWSLIDSQKRTWHDIVCGTLIVQLPKGIRSV